MCGFRSYDSSGAIPELSPTPLYYPLAGAGLADSKDREIELLLQMDIRREAAEAMDVKVQEWGVLATVTLIFSSTIGKALGKVLGVDLFWQSFFELPGSN